MNMNSDSLRQGRRYVIEGLEQRVLMSDVKFAVFGDYSSDTQTQPELDVSNLVKSWNPAFIVTTGDNNYPDGAATTIDANIGQYYHQYISPYLGSYGAGSADGVNHFWPSLGNHDWNTGTDQPYTDYFTLPGNERYYSVQEGNVGIFVVDSEDQEPDGNTATSAQAMWLKNALTNSTAQWKLVFFHHPAYSSGVSGSTPTMQWPFKDWGATAVFNGHDHDYERLIENGLPYFVDGLGGESITGFQKKAVSGSQVRYNGDYGAMLIDATDTTLTFKFITRTGQVIDTYSIQAPAAPLPAPWTDADVGSVGRKGSAGFTNPTFTVSGAGNDLGGKSDAFNYVYQTLSGNGEIDAQVTGVQNTSSSARAGVMIRESLATGARDVVLALTPSNQLAFVRRTSANRNPAVSLFSGNAAPMWVRLVRSGSTITAYRSSDGTNWTQVGSVSISMASSVYIGLAVASGNTAALNTSTFNGVSVKTSPPSSTGGVIVQGASFSTTPVAALQQDDPNAALLETEASA